MYEFIGKRDELSDQNGMGWGQRLIVDLGLLAFLLYR
jgi:hypothetical protein